MLWLVFSLVALSCFIMVIVLNLNSEKYSEPHKQAKHTHTHTLLVNINGWAAYLYLPIKVFLYVAHWSMLCVLLCELCHWIFCLTWSCSSPELEGSAVQMAEMYCKNLPLSKDLDPQESMHGEELLSMVCNILVQVSHATSRKSSLCCTYKFVLELFYVSIGGF